MKIREVTNPLERQIANEGFQAGIPSTEVQVRTLQEMKT